MGWVERVLSELTGLERGERAQQVSSRRHHKHNKSKPGPRRALQQETQEGQMRHYGARRVAIRHQFIHQTRGELDRRRGDDRQNRGLCSSSGGGEHSRLCCPLNQVPAERERAAAWVACRTKRVTLRAEVRMSAKMEALALLALPYQGERFTPRRVWSALRASA